MSNSPVPDDPLRRLQLVDVELVQASEGQARRFLQGLLSPARYATLVHYRRREFTANLSLSWFSDSIISIREVQTYALKTYADIQVERVSLWRDANASTLKEALATPLPRRFVELEIQRCECEEKIANCNRIIAEHQTECVARSRLSWRDLALSALAEIQAEAQQKLAADECTFWRQLLNELPQ